MAWWFVRTDVDGETDRTCSLAHLLAAPPLWGVEGLQRDRKLQRQAFRYKRELRQECIPIGHDDDVEYRLRL